MFSGLFHMSGRLLSRLSIMVEILGLAVGSCWGVVYHHQLSPSLLMAPTEKETGLGEQEDKIFEQLILTEELLSELNRWRQMQKLVGQLESDRRLLAELRKHIPPVRGEAEIYLKRMKELAASSDPVQLVPLAKRVIDKAPAYFNWLEREFETPEESMLEYSIGGAQHFEEAFDSFRNAVLLTVINRLDVIINLLE